MSFEPFPDPKEDASMRSYETIPDPFVKGRAIRAEIKKAEDILHGESEHPHAKAWEESLEPNREALLQNSAVIEARLSALTPEERQAFQERHDYLDEMIDKYGNALSKHSSSLEERDRLVGEKHSFEQQRSELEAGLRKKQEAKDAQ